ncbi:MAG: 4Fe-4S binding protein [Candidatus Thorarchaeota archaeon]
MVRRLMIQIDEEKCTGCGLCVPGCAEGALQIIGGKARLVSETYCDGLGACLGDCPEGALTLREVDTVDFDMEAAMDHVKKTRGETQAPCADTDGAPCAGSEAYTYGDGHDTEEHDGTVPEKITPSHLNQWPVKLKLLAPNHPALGNAKLLIVADCGGLAYAGLHEDFIKGRSVILACPKFEEFQPNLDKLTMILKINNIQDIALVYMEVPCCGGLGRLVDFAIAESGKEIPLRKYIIGVRGEIKAVF